ncbi:unnamed protein product [Larinioides sclopetarius]|uniref:Uncharacterized protein n=1 Tax=Larinioides sclopetarius TaxID=280406 RepID=A0AAV2BHW5_9ARAC
MLSFALASEHSLVVANPLGLH